MSRKILARAPGHLGLLLVGVLLGASGCVFHEQVQYFAATSTETGVTNYYKMTVTGSGGGGTDYHLQAGYFSSASVDMLRGSMPDIPILKLPVEQLEVLDRLTLQFYAALIQEAKRSAPIKDVEAMYVATSSRLSFAKWRLGRLEADQADLERQSVDADKRVKQLSGELDSARTEYQKATEKLAELKAAQSKTLKDVKELEDKVFSANAEVKAAAPGLRPAQLAEIQAKDTNAKDLKLYKEMASGLSPPASEVPADFDTQTTEQRAALRPLKTSFDSSTAKLTEAQEKLATVDADLKAKQAALGERIQELSGKQIELQINGSAVDAQGQVVLDARNKVDSKQRLHGVAQKDLNRLEHRLASIAADVGLNEAARDAAEKLLAKLKKAYESASIGELAAGVEVDPFLDAEVMQLARVIWFGSLSRSDIASMGMTQNTNPFQFRKLVFWATANNIDLNRFAGEIDMVIDNVIDAARSYQKIAANRKAERLARRKSFDGVLGGLVPAGQADAVRSLIDLMFPVGSTRPAGFDKLMNNLLPNAAVPPNASTTTGGSP